MAVNLFIFNSKQNRKFLVKVLAFLLVLGAVDWGLGAVIGHFFRRTLYGENWSKENWVLSRPYDVVILGSSRAFRSYVPSIMADSLKLSVFNAGANGQYLLYAYALEQMILETYKPKLILLDLLPNYVTQSEPVEQELGRMSALAPYADYKEVRRLLTQGKLGEEAKLRSQLYRYNSRLLSLAENYFKRPQGIDNGFVHIGKTRFRDVNHFADDLDTNPRVKFDPYRIEILKKFIRSAQAAGVPVVLCFSPAVAPSSAKILEILSFYQELANEMQVPMIKMTSESYPEFQERTLYSDVIHMNEPGARKYTPLFVKELRLVVDKKGLLGNI